LQIRSSLSLGGKALLLFVTIYVGLLILDDQEDLKSICKTMMHSWWLMKIMMMMWSHVVFSHTSLANQNPENRDKYSTFVCLQKLI